MTVARRTAIIVFGAAIAVWLSAAVRGSNAKRTPSSESTAYRSADDAMHGPRPQATRASRPLIKDQPLSAEPYAPPYGEEVGAEESAGREELVARSQAGIADLERRWEADAVSDGAMQFTERIRTLAEERGVAPGVLRNLECRATLCRLELGLEDQSDIADLLQVAKQLGARYSMQRKPGGPPALDVILERDPQNAAL